MCSKTEKYGLDQRPISFSLFISEKTKTETNHNIGSGNGQLSNKQKIPTNDPGILLLKYSSPLLSLISILSNIVINYIKRKLKLIFFSLVR